MGVCQNGLAFNATHEVLTLIVILNQLEFIPHNAFGIVFFFTKLILGSFAFKALCKFSLFIFFCIMWRHFFFTIAQLMSINATAQADKQAIKLGQPYYIPPYLNSKS